MTGGRDLAAAVALTLCWSALTLGGWFALRALWPALDPTPAAIAVTALLALYVAMIVSMRGWWQEVGLNGIRQWRRPALLILPAIIVIAPLAAGTKPLDASALGLLVIGYALTGFAEETMFRGILLRMLARRPEIAAVLISSLLFGLVHLGNIAIRGNPPVILAQMVGAFTFGIGYAALRARINTIWPLIVLHMLHDLFLQMTVLPLIPVDVAQDVVLVLYGIWLLRQKRAGRAFPHSLER